MNSTSHCFKFQGCRTSYLNPRPHTKRLRRIRNAQHFRFALNLVSTAQWFRLGGRRRSLLNAALWGYRSPIVYLS